MHHIWNFGNYVYFYGGINQKQALRTGYFTLQNFGKYIYLFIYYFFK